MILSGAPRTALGLCTSPPDGAEICTNEAGTRVQEPYTALDRLNLGDALDYGAIDPAPPRCVQARRDGRSYVYFIGGEGTPVKVGFSSAPYEPLASLQTASWVALSILSNRGHPWPTRRPA